MILTFFSADKYGIKSDIWKSFADGFEFFQKELEKYKASLNGAKFSLSDFNTALQQSKAKSLESGEAVDGLTLKLIALRAGAMLLNVALNAIVSTVANFVITKFNEWRTAIETNAQKSKELSSSMTDLISQYKELGDKSGWDTDDFAQAKDLNAEILDLLKNQSAEMDKKLRKLDLENGKYQEQIDLLNELSISTLTQNKADQGKLLEQTAKGKSSGQYVIGDSSDTNMANALGGKFGGSLDNNTGVFNFGGFDPNDADSILAYYDKLSNALDYLGSNYDSATLEASSLYNQLKSEKNAIEDQANAYRSSSDTLKEVIAAQKLSSTSSKRSEEDIKAVTDALEGLKGAYGGITSGNLVSFLSGDKKLGGTYSDALNQLKEVMLNLGFEDNASDAQAFVDVLVQLGIVSSSSASKVDGLSESASAAADQLKEATDGLDKIQSAYSTLSDVVDEYNKNGYLTVSTLTDLINLGPEYYDCLVDESGQLAINTENINTMADAYYEMAKAALYAQAIESLNANTNTYANASKFLSQAQQEVKDMKSLLYAEGQRLIDAGGLSGDALATQVQAQNRIINTYSAMMDLLDKTHAQSAENQFRNPKDKSSNKSSGSEDKMTDAVSAWKTLSAAMEEYNQYGNLCISTLNDLLGLEDDYTSLLTEQNGKMSINTTEFKNLMFAQIAQANATDESGKSAAELKRILQYVDENVKGDTISFEQLTDAIEGYGTAMDKAKQKTDAIKSAFSGLYEVMNNKTDRSNPFGLLDSDDVEKQHEALLQLAKDTDVFKSEAYNPETGEVDFNSKAFKDSVVEYLNGMADAAAQTGGAGAKAIEKNWRDAANAIAEGKISVEEFYNGLGSSLDKATKEIDDFQSAFSDIGDIVKEYNLYGGLSIDNYQKLMALSPDYLSCLKLEGDQLVFNEAAYKQLLIDKLDDMIKTYRQADATQELADRLEELRDGLKSSKASFTGATDAAKNFEDTLSNIKSLLTDLVGVFEQVNTDKSNDLKIQGDAWLEVIDKRIDALNEQSDAQERAIELQKAQDAFDKAKANKTVHVYHASGSGFEWEADQNAVRDAQSTLNDTIRKNRKEDELDRLNKLKEAVQKNNELIGSSFEDYEKKKKYLAEFDKMTYDEMIKYNDEWKDSILGNMKSAQAVTNVNDTITKIEKLISTLETLNNVLKALDTGFASTDGGGLTGLFSNGGILSKVGKFFNIASKDGLGAAINKTGEWFSGKLGTALEANPNNPIIKAFSNIWTKVGEGAGAFFNGSGSTGLGGIIKEGLEKIGGLTGSEGFLGQIVTKGGDLLAKIGVGGGATATTSAIPVIGPIIAVAVNNAVQQFGKISKENTKIWADQNSSTGEKIVKSVGNVLYHLSPVEGWDKSLQYAKAAAEGDNIWDKFKNGAKSLYYGCGLGVVVDNIFSTVKSILGVFGIKFKDTNSSSSDSTASSSEKKKWYESKIFFWNWGKKAKGDKKIRNAGPYNVDEQGEEIIVHKPQTGRMTYLEKGDGVVPANETANLMAIGKNPTGWASGIFNNLLGSKLSGIADLIQKAIANGAKKTFKEFGKGTSSDISDLVDKAKEKTLSQILDMTDAMSDAWKSVADETGVSQDKIEATSSEIFNRMQKLAEQTYSAINDNAGMSAEQVETVSEQLFEALQSIYTSGWNDIYATSDKMSEETASLLNSAYSGSAASCKKSMSSISSILKSSWSKCGGGTKNLANNTYKTLSKAWADTSQDAQKMMYDVRACFDTSWGAVEQGTSDLANGTESTLTDAWASISSKSSEVFGQNGSLQQDADKSWSNVDPGATNLSDNMAWVMDRSYESMKNGCAEAIDDVKQQVNAAADEFKATASQTENQTTEPAKEPEVKKEPEKKKNIIEKAWDATVDAVEYVANSVSDFFSGLFGHASGLKSASSSHFANVDELGPELLVRKPQSGRYTYLETGDGVVPADITSRLFEMGGNPDRWFQNQMSKYGSQSIAAKGAGSMSFSTGDIIIQNPVGSANDLASEIKREMPNKMAQEWNKR